MQGWTATKRYGITKKKHKKIKAYRCGKNLQLKDVC